MRGVFVVVITNFSLIKKHCLASDFMKIDLKWFVFFGSFGYIKHHIDMDCMSSTPDPGNDSISMMVWYGML